MTVNWAELMQSSGGAFEPLPKSTYDVVVDTAEATKSSTDKLMFKIRFKVEGGPHNGRTIYNNITVTPDNPNAMRMFFLNMKSMGLGAEYFAMNPTPDQIAAGLVGQRATVVIDHRMYQGQMRENVKSLMPRAGGLTMGPAMTAGGPMAPGGPIVPTPGANPMVPSGMPQSSPVVPQPAPAATVAPPVVESTVSIPAPQNPAPAAAPVQMPTPMPMPAPAQSLVTEPPAAPAAPALPPGMTQEQYEQFMAFQAAQAAATNDGTPVSIPEAPAAAPAMPTMQQSGLPAGAPPLPPGTAF